MLLPAGLERLELYSTDTGVVDVALARLPTLIELEVYDTKPVVVVVDASIKLRKLMAIGSTVWVSPRLPNALKRLELTGWGLGDQEAWHSCAHLDWLILFNVVAETLPEGWLVHCKVLRRLWVDKGVNLRTLPANALHGATALQDVKFRNCALEALPTGLLDHAPALRVLDLSQNQLLALPCNLFVHSPSLLALDLSKNHLDGSVLDALVTVTSLKVLRLDGNVALDACSRARISRHGQGPVLGSSPLRNLTNLTFLTLYHTATRHVCADWRRLPRLTWLDISDTAITSLNYTDLQFNTTVDKLVVIASINHLSMSRGDYYSVTGAGARATRPALKLRLTNPLLCDCKLYWAAAALNLSNSRFSQENARCGDQRALRDVPLDELVCATHGPCPVGCTCGVREDTARPGRVLRVYCTGAQLRTVPFIDARASLQDTAAQPVALDLHLAGNRIDSLKPEDLPPAFSMLDLRNNSLRVIEVGTVEALVTSEGRRVLLAGNPLDCSCYAAAALAAMRARTDVFIDWADATCFNGTVLSRVSPLPCDEGGGNVSESIGVTESMSDDGAGGVLKSATTLSPWGASKDVSGASGMSAGVVTALTLGAAAAGALLLALMLALTRPMLRRRLTMAMRAQPPGILQLQRRRPAPDEWAYDAFVSFAHADEAVVRELVEKLEGGAAPLRLCVHYRDWVPGGWIPAQIAASVRVSRRTVAVVSEAFMRSKWARAEFREAYAAALEDSEPRLVLVLLEDPMRLRLDTELLAYVNGNTYVRWGDPWFWRKLRQALPAPIVRPAAERHVAPASPAPGHVPNQEQEY